MKANRYRISIPLAVTVILWFVSVSVAQQLPKAKLTELGISAEKLENLSTVLNSYVKDGRLAGSVAMVLRNGKVVYLNSFGYRDLESRSPMRTDSIFRIASQSKALTSVGIMIMQEEGKLLISDPLSKYLPEFANTTVAQPKDGGGYDIVKAKRAITIRDLLTHTSGISYGSGPAKDKWKLQILPDGTLPIATRLFPKPSNGLQHCRWMLSRVKNLSMAIRPTFSVLSWKRSAVCL